MDSLPVPSRLTAYSGEQVLRYSREKDYTDTELAFNLLCDKGCTEIWIIGGGGGRVDHLFAIRSLCERELFPRRWILDNADIYCIQADCMETDSAAGSVLSLRLEKNALVSLFPLAEGPWKVCSQGLRWPLDDIQWNRGLFGLSNIALAGELILNIQQGRFMLIVPCVNKECYVGDNN
jgi:thiamine pyrophosphokinase